jgi:hypothetical protein
MTTRSVLAWIAQSGAWEAEKFARIPLNAGSETVRPENRSYHLPSADEIRAVTREIQAGWSEAERLSRLVGGGSTENWTVPAVKTAGVTEPAE